MKKLSTVFFHTKKLNVACNNIKTKRYFSQTLISYSNNVNQQQQTKKRIMFFGTDTFSLPTLQLLHTEFVKSDQAELCIICPPDRKTLRRNQYTMKSCTVKDYCLENNLPFFHPLELHEKKPDERKKIQRLGITDLPLHPLLFGEETVNRIKELEQANENVEVIAEENINFNPKFDIGVVVSFGYFIQPSIIQQFKQQKKLQEEKSENNQFSNNIFNIHPSILPRYRGPAPIHHTLLNGDNETGITIIELDEKQFDIGKIIRQERFPVGKTETFNQLHDRLANKGAELLIETIKSCNFDMSSLKRKTQLDLSTEENVQPTKAKKVNAALGNIEFNEDIMTIYNKWRALDKVFIPYNNIHRMLLKSIDYPIIINNNEAKHKVGTLFKENKSLFLQCNGGILKILSLQIETKKEMLAEAFLLGHNLPLELPLKN
ncbi:hypothetical protein ABK040_010686 [Willaertia magna]